MYKEGERKKCRGKERERNVEEGEGKKFRGKERERNVEGRREKEM